MFFFQGSLCLWLLAQTSPTQEEEKQSYEIGWSLRLLQSNDKEGDADNAVALKWHFQRLHKGEKGKAGDRLNNCLSGLWTFQVGRKGHGRISLQGSQASKGFYKGILMQTSSCKPLPTWVYLCCVHLVEKKKKKKLSGDSNPRPNAFIKSIMQDMHFQEAASARSQKTLHALTEKLDKRPLWVEAKLVPGVVHFANTSPRALSFRKRVRLTQCHCSGDCYFSDPKSQIISMVILPGRQACNRILINYLSTAQLYRLICWQTLQ